MVEQIHQLDLRCGLWLAPFMVQPGTVGLGTDHEDWCIVDDATGATLRDRHERWALDASNPAVVDYLRELGAQVRAWGVDMVKLDFLYEGAQEGRRHDPRVTGTQALRRGLRAFVDQLGEDVYVLGCGAPMLAMVGICHANRIGHDLAVPVLGRVYGQPLRDGWTGWKGVKAQARQAAARWATHGRWFHNDPEIVMAWGSDGRGGDDGYSLEEAHTQAVVAALVGGPFLLADQLSTLLPEEWAVLEDPELLDLAWDERGFRPSDLFEHPDHGRQHAYSQPADLPSVWVAERDGRRVVALFNWTDEPATRTAPDGTTRRRSRPTARGSSTGSSGRSGLRSGQHGVDVSEVVAAFVDRVPAEPDHRPLGRGRIVVDPGPLPLVGPQCRERISQRIGGGSELGRRPSPDPVRCTGRGSPARRDPSVGTPGNPPERERQPLPLHVEDVSDVAAILERGPDLGVRMGPQRGGIPFQAADKCRPELPAVPPESPRRKLRSRRIHILRNGSSHCPPFGSERAGEFRSSRAARAAPIRVSEVLPNGLLTQAAPRVIPAAFRSSAGTPASRQAP